MHRSLRILEIVEVICSNLDPMAALVSLSSRKLEDRRTLCALARTCSLFNGPALDVLWRTQTKFGPFLRLMPDGLFAPFRGPRGKRIWHMLRPIMVNDWNRPLVYSPRVRILSLDDWVEIVEILPALSLCCPGGFLFPNLQTFNWHHPDKGLSLTRAFFPSTLKQITILCEASTTNISLLSTLATSCPGLTHVSIAFETPSDHVDTAMSLFVCTLKNLESLTIGRPNMAVAQHLAQLPGLTRLVMGPINIESATNFLCSLAHAPLVTLEVTLATFVPLAATDALFHAVRTACAHNSLKTFFLHNSASTLPPVARESYIITGRSIENLVCFPNIRTVSIMAPVGYDLDDATVTKLAAAWPHLQNLWLETGSVGGQPQTTLQSLHAFARHCPELSWLSIEFDARSIPLGKGASRVVQTKLAMLEVGSSLISAATPVARYLSSIFPDLEEIITARENKDNDDPDEIEGNGSAIALHRLWKQVEEQIPEFVAAREEERTWARANWLPR
ncbi:hypothetical protein B0H19DRAFT_1151588 [Mycena capillaripes]|nr:hypothetical protein B0H19DRAFT_1151588 [Mycena capillaripes]